VTGWRESWRDWLPETVLGVMVALLGVVEALTTDTGVDSRLPLVLVALCIALAVASSRHAPELALALVWVTCALQLVNDVPLLLVEVAIAVVAFGTARWGGPVTLVLSGLSIPLAGLIVVLALDAGLFRGLVDVARTRAVIDAISRLGDTWQVGVALVAMTLLLAPWLAGLALRFSARASASRISQVAAEADAARAQREAAQAQEIARLRDEQARMARDVHDVVGHSLAVILAQAESAQFLPDDDPEGLKRTMSTIATSARGSLQDVRQVLSATGPPSAAPPGDLDLIIEGVQASGHEVVSTVVGSPQPLPPDLEVVAFRVLQEMLTNAIRHGRRDGAVLVERHWPDSEHEGLRIEVRNVVQPPAAETTMPIGVPDAGGHGLDGMRRRLESVGGRLDLRRRDEPDGPTFTVTAWVPVRARAR
jgi:signal transduction histidine kinase